MIVGLVIGGIAIIIIGGLFIFCALYRRRRQRTRTAPTAVPSFNASQSVVVPSIRNQTPVPFGYARASPAPISPYLTSPVHSTTSLPTSLISPISSGFSSHGHNVLPVNDAADMISPFLIPSSSRQANGTNASSPTGKAAEALSERVMTPPGQRARLNPPPYSPSVEPGSSGSATTTTWERRLSKKQKKRKSSLSGMTTYSGHSRTSTRESVTTAHAGTRTEQTRSRAASPGMETTKSVKSTMSAGGVGNVDGGRVGQRPPAV